MTEEDKLDACLKALHAIKADLAHLDRNVNVEIRPQLATIEALGKVNRQLIDRQFDRLTDRLAESRRDVSNLRDDTESRFSSLEKGLMSILASLIK